MRKYVLWVVLAVSIAANVLFLSRSYVLDSKKNLEFLDSSVANSNVQQQIINFDPLRQDLKAYFAKLNLSHSFYFEYLPNGVNIRDGADQVSVAASLIKTPVVMDLYKVAEQGKINLDDKLTIQKQDISYDADYGNPSGLQVGQTITLREAGRKALHDSDNTSINIIHRSISPYITADTDAIHSLDVSYTVNKNDANNQYVEISARSYSSILKCLYYSCFLTPKDSEEILRNLIGSENSNRLAAGVPSDIMLAHKIGSGFKAQSDCGIVYYPKKPYLLCLMFWDYPQTKGNDTDAYFKQVSQKVSDYIKDRSY